MSTRASGPSKRTLSHHIFEIRTNLTGTAETETVGAGPLDSVRSVTWHRQGPMRCVSEE